MSYLPDDVPGPLPDPDDETFWLHCNEGKLKFRRCQGCGHVQHPPLHFCPRCLETAHDWIDAPAHGEVFTYTVTHHPSHPSVKGAMPYNVVVVDFPALGHVRLVSNLVDGNDGISIGMKVQLVWEDQGGTKVASLRTGRPVGQPGGLGVACDRESKRCNGGKYRCRPQRGAAPCLRMTEEPMSAPSLRGFSPMDLAEGFDLAPVGLCITEFRQIVCCNEEFCRIFGFEKSELEGHSLQKLYPTLREFDNTGKQVMPILRVCGRHADDRLMKHRDGHLFWCHVAGRSFSTEEPFAHAIWMFEDLSDRRKTNVLLTPREREVVKLLARGATSKEIARSLGISHRTVEAHRMRLGRKLDAGTTVEIVSKLAGLY